ncbi:unnamed protein product [Boreogadus saida]
MKLRPGGMRGVLSAAEMTLVLNAAVGCVSPTKISPDRSALQCEGLNNQSYVCTAGHCCAEDTCCSYYYELWWFWLVWAIIFILSCCCVCHHRRTKHRLQQQQRQHEINLIAYREAHNYSAVPFYFRFLPNSLLPDYEEVVNRPPTPPPPYSALHTVSPPLAPGPLGAELQEAPPPPAAPPPDGPRPRPGLEEAGPGGGGGFLPKADDKSPRAARLPGAITRTDGGEGGEGGGRAGEEEEEEKRQRGGAGDSGKEPGGPGEKRPLPVAGRRRRFTGDSGIEVCVCSARGGRGPGAEGEGEGEGGGLLKELESLLGCTEDEEEAGGGGGGGRGEFCESCGPRAHLGEGEGEEEGEEGEDPEPAHRSGSGTPPPSIHQQEALPRGPQP